MRILLASGLCCLLFAGNGAAQDRDRRESGWSSLRVPGGVAGMLAAAGLDETLPRTRALRDVIHVIYDTTGDADASLENRRRGFLGYLEAVSAVEAARAAMGQPPPSLLRAEDRNVRSRLEAVAEVIGCTLERVSRTYQLRLDSGEQQARRRSDLARAGLDVEAVVKAANAGQPLSLDLRSDQVPLPLAPETWTAIVRTPQRFSGSLATAVLGNPRTALLYYGLLGLDSATRAFLDQHPQLLQDLIDSERVAVFAGYGQGIRVASGRLVVPGGPAAEPQWEALADESVARPDRFILKLLDKDGGRLASLFDLAYSLDSRRQAFVIGPGVSDPGGRIERFRRLYDMYGRLLTGWDARARPFVRTLYDGAHILATTPIDARGLPTGPTSVKLWRKAFAGTDIPSDPAGELGDPASDGMTDAPWLLETMADAGRSFATRRTRIEAWLFGQRVFGGAQPQFLPDVLTTIRGFSGFRVLLWTMERMGVRDPRLYAAATERADRLSRIGDRDQLAVALAIFQGTLALVDRARAARTLDAAAVESMLRSFLALPVSESGEYLGHASAWMGRTLVPALAERVPPLAGSEPTAAEEIILGAMAGRALSMADSPNLGLWLEGLPYSVDPGSAELARMRAVRERQRGVPIDVALEIGRAAAAFGAPSVSIARLPALVADLERAGQAVLRLEGPGVAWLGKDWFRGLMSSSAGAVRKIKKPGDLRKLDRVMAPFLGVSDRLLAQAILSLVYAAVLRDAQSTTLLDGDPAPRHDWGFDGPVGEPSQPPPWREPQAERTGGWHLKGSILGADLALARESLRRVSLDRFPSPPTFSELDEQIVAESVALIAPFDQSDADRESIVSALRRGRRQMEDVLDRPALWPGAAVRMDIRDFRRELVAWAITHEPEAVPALLSLGELVRLGGLPDLPGDPADAFGVSGRAFDGRWSLRYPLAPMFDLFAGRKGSMLPIGLVPDLVLSVSEVMHERRLPAVLTRSVLECAARDAIDEVPMQYFDDWVTLVGRTRVQAGRLDEYLASLTSGGPLMPVAR